MILLRNVFRKYSGSATPVVALDGVSLSISEGEFVAVTGPSGCGKSTLLNLLGALDSATSGEIIVDGLALHSAPEDVLTLYRREKLGVVFQFFNLLPTMSVLENVTLPLLLAGKPFSVAKPIGLEILDLVGLRHREDHFTHQLSGGEMQRTAIARALVHKPRLLLADEPTGNLDSANACGIMEVLGTISRTLGTTIVIVTHSEELANVASRRVRMKDGKIASSIAVGDMVSGIAC